MMNFTTKQEHINHLVKVITDAFSNVELEDGIGLWEAQGIDTYANEEELKILRAKDEKENWHIISYDNLVACQSSLSFFDAKGMLFHLPAFLLFDLLEEKLQKTQDISAPEIMFTLSQVKLNAQFYLFNFKHLNAVLAYIEFKQSNDDDDDEKAYLDKILKDWTDYFIEKEHKLYPYSKENPQDNLLFTDPLEENEKFVFNFYTWCSIIEGIMVRYGNKNPEEAHQILNESKIKKYATKSYGHAILTAHDTEYHWAMLLSYGEMYWLNRISSDEPEGFYEWDKQYRITHNLAKESFEWDNE